MATKGEESGFDCQLVQAPPANLLQTECPICLQVIRDPHQVTCCGYSYCHSCIEQIRSINKPCPTCQEKEFSVFPNKGLRRSLYSLKAYCTNKKDGCEWTGELGQLDAHLNGFPLVPKKQLEGCPFVVLKCLDCDMTVKRCDLERHVETDCSVVIDCEFLRVGCKVQLPRKELSKHLKDELATHMSLLALGHAKQQDEIAQQKTQIAELSNLTQAHESEIARLRAENEALKNKFQPVIEVARENIENLPSSEIVVMNDYQRHKDDDIVWYSPPLYTHPQGYKVCFAVYPNGDGPGKNTHLSVYTHLMPGDFDDQLAWPIRGEIRYQLLSQDGSDVHKAGVSTYHERRSDKSCSRVLYAQRSQGLGMGKFLPFGQLEAKYLQNDCLKLQICGGNVRL